MLKAAKFGQFQSVRRIGDFVQTHFCSPSSKGPDVGSQLCEVVKTAGNWWRSKSLLTERN